MLAMQFRVIMRGGFIIESQTCYSSAFSLVVWFDVWVFLFVAFFLVATLHLLLNTRLCRAVICTTNLGLEYNVKRTPGNHLAFSINACCPCRSQPLKYQLPYCGLTDLMTKVADIKAQANSAHRSFVGIKGQ